MSICLVVLLRQNETVIPGELPLVQELTSTLREWVVIWRKLYVVSFPLGLEAGSLISGLLACLSCCKVSAMFGLCVWNRVCVNWTVQWLITSTFSLSWS